MIRLADFNKIYLCKSIIDMRKAINGLSAYVQNHMQLNPFEKYLFVFTGRKRDGIKILYWHRNGFCLWQKKLSRDKFVWTKSRDGDAVLITEHQLRLLLDGLDIWAMKPHETLNYTHV